MIQTLTREFRFAWTGRTLADRNANAWCGWNTTLDLAPQLRLRWCLTGPVSHPSGYICNIREMDEAMRRALNRACEAANPGLESAPELLTAIANSLEGSLPSQLSGLELTLQLTPQLSLRQCRKEPNVIFLTHQFEFSAAHRLDCPEWSPQQNLAVFGKCNNPSGHGHNYLLDICVAIEPSPTGLLVSPAVPPSAAPQKATRTAADGLSFEQFQMTVKREIIQRYDHKHLNLDVDEFRTLNPTVENIARVIFERLEGVLAPLRLEKVRVYETPKTWADCTRRHSPLAADA